MKNTFLVITSIADDRHPILNHYAIESKNYYVPFIVIGDTKSPSVFSLEGAIFYSIKEQEALNFKLVKLLPYKHYARKNLGYLLAISKGATVILETDDDNLPLDGFWHQRSRHILAHPLCDSGWVNVYRFFTNLNIWPRGFALEMLSAKLPLLNDLSLVDCPIQQGLADDNPDVDAIYRLTMQLPFSFDQHTPVALGSGSICPFNSQNTTWFKDAFPLLYLPYYCSFRMTDIWRSFVAQRIAWTCGWSILFHSSSVRQERNEHNLMLDFKDEIPGYLNNLLISTELNNLMLESGIDNIPINMKLCYQKLIEIGCVGPDEIDLLSAWLDDLAALH
jgi:hypothetical protein